MLLAQRLPRFLTQLRFGAGRLTALVVAFSAMTAVGVSSVRCQQASNKIGAVMELFTSQGCSSCPEADRLLQSYTQTPNVLALSFAVDIWDNLGWRDTLASPKFTQRQRAYAKMRHDGNIYTPQVIFNGGAHAVGSKKDAIDTQLSYALTRKSEWIDISVRWEGGHVVVTAPERGGLVVPEATLWLVTYRKRVEVPVTRGENAGQTLSYHNVVRDMIPVGMWTGSELSVRLPRDAMSDAAGEAAAVIMQQGKGGRIVGAAYVSKP